MNVGFIVVGAQKSGTTALDLYLRMHPMLCMAERKELHFFDKDELFVRGYPDYDFYHSFFSPRSDQMLGESTPSYMYWADAPRRIWQYNPDMKLIVVLRNPVDRAYSHWNMERSRGFESLSFFDAITNESERLRQALPAQHLIYSYVDRGFYLPQLRRLWQFFTKKQVLVLKHEALRVDPEFVLDQVCSFLDIKQLIDVEHLESHVLAYDSSIRQQEREYLLQVFKYEIHALELELNWDCSDWLC